MVSTGDEEDSDAIYSDTEGWYGIVAYVLAPKLNQLKYVITNKGLNVFQSNPRVNSERG